MDYVKHQLDIERRRMELRHRLLEISSKQRQLEQELAAVHQELQGLDQMYAGTEIAVGRIDAPARLRPGLTEYVRNLLVNTQVPMTAKQIRDSCVEVGITASSRRNLLIAIYTVLKRMDLDLKTVSHGGRRAFLPRPTLISRAQKRRRR